MILNQRTLIFLLIVFLIIITLFHNKFSINKNNKNLLLLAIILSMFIFYNKFVTPRVEDFIENKLYENFDEEEEEEEETTETTTPSPLRRLYLNKSPYHRTFSRTKPITRMTVSNNDNTEQEDEDDKEEKIGESHLNLYNNVDISNTAETTMGKAPLQNLLKFNYLSTDDMIQNIGKRHYNFPIVNLNFNQDENAVTTNDEATPTDISSIIYTTDNKNNDNEDNEDIKNDTDSDDDDDKNTTPDGRKRTAVVSQQSTERDGLSAFINNFFTSVQSIFE